MPIDISSKKRREKKSPYHPDFHLSGLLNTPINPDNWGCTVIEKLKNYAFKTEEGKKLVSESQKELQKKTEMIVKTTNDKKLSPYRENTLKSLLAKTRDLKKKIYSHDELKKMDELKNKQLNDVEAIAVTDIPKKWKKICVGY